MHYNSVIKIFAFGFYKFFHVSNKFQIPSQREFFRISTTFQKRCKLKNTALIRIRDNPKATNWLNMPRAGELSKCFTNFDINSLNCKRERERIEIYLNLNNCISEFKKRLKLLHTLNINVDIT